jgi:hypothetical protein
LQLLTTFAVDATRLNDLSILNSALQPYYNPQLHCHCFYLKVYTASITASSHRLSDVGYSDIFPPDLHSRVIIRESTG